MLKQEDQVFTALADANRRRLLTTLAQGSPKTATQLARDFARQRHAISRQGIAKHLHLLAQSGLIQSQTQGREKRYAFDPASLKVASDWIDALGRQWDERLLRLKTLVEETE